MGDVDEFVASEWQSAKQSMSDTKIQAFLKQRIRQSIHYSDGLPRQYSNQAELSKQCMNVRLDIQQVFSYIKQIDWMPVVDEDDVMMMVEHCYMEHSRMLKMEKVPKWLYAVLLLLGWNELMLVIRTPLYLVMVLIAGVAYGVYKYELPIQHLMRMKTEKKHKVQ